MSYVPPEAVPICAADGTGVEDLLHVLDAAAWAEKGSAVETFCSFDWDIPGHRIVRSRWLLAFCTHVHEPCSGFPSMPC